jgi:hypothetical protein
MGPLPRQGEMETHPPLRPQIPRRSRNAQT